MSDFFSTENSVKDFDGFLKFIEEIEVCIGEKQVNVDLESEVLKFQQETFSDPLLDDQK